MRFLVDRCAGSTLAKWLRDQGHDVDDANEWRHDPGDATILKAAEDADRILVTIDTDFGLLIFVDEMSHRGLVRLPDCPAAERIAIPFRFARAPPGRSRGACGDHGECRPRPHLTPSRLMRLWC